MTAAKRYTDIMVRGSRVMDGSYVDTHLLGTQPIQCNSSMPYCVTSLHKHLSERSTLSCFWQPHAKKGHIIDNV